MKARWGATDYGKSEHTPIKQAAVRRFARDRMNKAKYLVEEKGKGDWPYLYFDLFAGPGTDDAGDDGSPVIVLEQAERMHVPVDARLFEINAGRAAQLRANVARFAALPGNLVQVYQADCQAELVECLDALGVVSARRTGSKLERCYGMLYADPTSMVPWETICEASQRLPLVDVLINISAANHNRVRLSHGQLLHIADCLDDIGKTHWLVRRVVEKHNWTMLFGTNDPNIKELTSLGFHFTHKPIGQWFMAKVNWTNTERPDIDFGGQLPLL